MDIRVFILLVIPVAVFAANKEIACEGFRMKLHCKEGSIKIVDAMYGRQKKNICHDKNADSINCSYGKAKKIVSQECKGKQKCKMNVDNELFHEDPCPGISKYLEVHYKCVASGSDSSDTA